MLNSIDSLRILLAHDPLMPVPLRELMHQMIRIMEMLVIAMRQSDVQSTDVWALKLNDASAQYAELAARYAYKYSGDEIN